MNTATANDKMIMKLETGEVEIQLFPEVAPFIKTSDFDEVPPYE